MIALLKNLHSRRITSFSRYVVNRDSTGRITATLTTDSPGLEHLQIVVEIPPKTKIHSLLLEASENE